MRRTAPQILRDRSPQLRVARHRQRPRQHFRPDRQQVCLHRQPVPQWEELPAREPAAAQRAEPEAAAVFALRASAPVDGPEEKFPPGNPRKRRAPPAIGFLPPLSSIGCAQMKTRKSRSWLGEEDSSPEALNCKRFQVCNLQTFAAILLIVVEMQQ